MMRLVRMYAIKDEPMSASPNEIEALAIGQIRSQQKAGIQRETNARVARLLEDILAENSETLCGLRIAMVQRIRLAIGDLRP